LNPSLAAATLRKPIVVKIGKKPYKFEKSSKIAIQNLFSHSM